MDDTLLIILGNQLFDKKYISKANTKNIFMAKKMGKRLGKCFVLQ